MLAVLVFLGYIGLIILSILLILCVVYGIVSLWGLVCKLYKKICKKCAQIEKELR